MKKIKFNTFIPKNEFKKNLFDKNVFNNHIKDIEKNLNLKNSVFFSFSKNFHLNVNATELNKFKKKYQRIVVIGMGGSILGCEAIYFFLKNKIKKEFIFIDNLDETKINALRNIKNLKNSLFLIISKSGNTIETLATIEALKKAHLSKKNTIIITDNKKSELSVFARKHKIKIVHHRGYIGGRYSVLSETGIIPAYLMGINTNLIRKDILFFLKNSRSELKNNLMQIFKIYSSKKINSLILLNYCPELNGFMEWYKQLIAESLGKKGKGLTPIHSIAPKDHHSLLQLYLDGPKDKFFYIFSNKMKKTGKNFNKNFSKTLLNSNVDQVKKAQKEALIKVFKDKNIPFMEIEINNIKEDVLGLLFSYFILETVLISKQLNINPYNQPAVEEVKLITKKILSR